MKFKTLTALSLLSLLLGTSCIRRTVSQDFGIPGLTSMPRAKPQPALSPDASVRAVFQQQTQRAFNPARAIDQLKHTLAELTSTDPKTANTWNELGLRYEDVASLSDAQSAFEHAIEANPASESAHNNLGYNLLLQSRLEAAEAEFRNAIELNPASTVARSLPAFPSLQLERVQLCGSTCPNRRFPGCCHPEVQRGRGTPAGKPHCRRE